MTGPARTRAVTAARRSEYRRGIGPLSGALFVYAGSPIILLQTNSIFVAPEMKATGLSATAVTIGPIITLTLGVLQPVVGWLAQRYPPRRFALIALVGFAVGLIAFGTFPPSFGMFWGLGVYTGVVGALAYWATLSRFLSLWFRRNLGIAIGIVGGAASLLPLAAIPVMSHFIYSGGGWRAGYWTLFAFVVVIAIPIAFALFREPKEPIFADDAALRVGGPAADERGTADEISGLPLHKIVKDGRFWTMLLAFALVTVGAGGFISNIAPILIGRGFSPALTTGLSMAILVGVLLGRLSGGLMIDRFWPYAAPLVIFCLSGIGAILTVGLPVGTATVVMWAAVIALGLSQGAEGDFSSFFLLREFGARHFGVINGWAVFVTSIGLFIGGFAVPFVRDLTGSYTGVAAVTALFYFAGALVCLVTGFLSVRAHRAGGTVFAGRGAEV
ncbi:MFS transporter [Actinomadura sp. LOL_016]|uniref:MFS transporter n=1 Tax=unclassified Actinomadura TaxID=2626254 RepID=UPI003A8029CA